MRQWNVFHRVSVFLPLALIIALGIAGWIILSGYATSSIDRLARDNAHKHVEVAIKVEKNQLVKTFQNVASWDQFHDKSMRTHDVQWIDDHIGPRLYHERNINLSFVMDGNDNPVVSFLDGKRVDLKDFFKAEELSGLLGRTRHNVDVETPGIEYIAIQGQPYLLAVGLLMPEDRTAPANDGSVLGLGIRLDARWAASLSEIFQLDGLQLSDIEERDAKYGDTSGPLLLNNLAGQPVVAFSWPQPTPARDVQVSLQPYLIAITTILIALVFMVFYIEIQSHREREELLHKIASEDHVTGINNRREFFTMAERELARASRDGRPTHLLLLDIDQFKKINDVLGHATGDRLLSLVGEELKDQLRPFDVVARYGGDEFVILLVDASREQSYSLAERLRGRIAELSTQSEGSGLRFTASIGIAEFRENDTIESLVERADNAVDTAKHGGRNRTEFAT